jgi:Mrp family chromosome partitioning ATPase
MLTKRLLWDGESSMADQQRGAVYRDEVALLWSNVVANLGAPPCVLAFVPIAWRTDNAAAVAANLAVHLASAGKATFLVDASLREPHLSRLGIGATLEEVANAPERLADVGRVDSVGPLRVLAAERPLAPLDSMQVADRLPSLVRRLAELADHVIIASSPVVGSPESRPTLSSVDAAVIVAEALRQQTGQAKRAAEALHELRVPLVGSVLTEARYPLPPILGG